MMIRRSLLFTAMLMVVVAPARGRQIVQVDEQDAGLLCAASRIGGTHAIPVAGKAARRSGAGFDAGYYRIELDLATDTPGLVEGATRIVGTVTAPVLSVLELDFHASMSVESITMPGGGNLTWTSISNILAVDLDSPATAGERLDLTVHYSGWPQATGFGSFDVGTRGQDQPYAWTLSEPYGARTWWPGVDHPSDKADSVDVVVTVRDPMKVASNGLLAGTRANGDGTTTWTWSHRYPISSYLVSIAAGIYDRYTQQYERPDSLAAVFGAASFPIEHFEYAGSTMFKGTHSQNGWRRVTDIMPVLEWWYGPYPFENEKYGHAQFTWGGGMEHQTITSMGGNSVGLIAHELTHQWYGDAVGPKTWPELWLNEGFATMGELLNWDTMRDTYPGVYESVFTLYWNRARGAQGTLVLEDTTSVGNMFASARVYAKGGMVLHMLRSMVGDELFRQVMRSWAADPEVRYRVGSTSDFKRVAEEVTGLDLGPFFSQWVTSGTGYPVYEAKWSTAPRGDGWLVRVVLSQTQASPVSNVSVFEMPVVIRIETETGTHDFTVRNDRRSQIFQLDLDEKPLVISIDPDRRILRGPEVGVEFEGVLPIRDLPAAKLTSVHPNPASGTVHLDVDGVGGRSGSLELVDGTGRRVLRRELILQAGPQTIPVDVSNLAAGIYVVTLMSDGSRESRTVVIVR